ncbi:MAG: LOG family protein [Pirellulales bacterium]
MSAPERDASRAVSLADEEGVQQIIFASLLGLWEVVNNLTRIRPTRRERYRVTIFGSARAAPGSHVYNEVKRVATALAELDCDIITGGGPGLMQAANEGADDAGVRDRTQSTGIRIDLPFEQQVNPFVEQAFLHKTFFTRLHHFVLASDAFIVAPGGIGTTLEACMIWQLLQVRHVQDVPLVFVGEMWFELIAWAQKHMLGAQPPFASPADVLLPKCVHNAHEAIEFMRREHARWLQRAT